MDKINFQNGILVAKAKVTINGTVYEVEPEEYEGETPLSAETLNEMQNNVEKAINEVDEKMQRTVLYKNINGKQASSGITLSESVDNYDFIEIYCGKSIAQGLNCAKIDLSIANTVSITNYVKLTSGEAQFITSALSVNGTSLTQISCQYLNISGERAQVGESTEMSVYEVIGYKY